MIKPLTGRMYNVAVGTSTAIPLICIGRPKSNIARFMRTGGDITEILIDDAFIDGSNIHICDKHRIVKATKGINTEYTRSKNGKTTPKVGNLYVIKQRNDLGDCICIRTYANCSCEIVILGTGAKKRLYNAYVINNSVIDIVERWGN